jgi:tetrapyrrole methylase family protein/MazG family protein
MPTGIVIVGLGPGSPELWTTAARQALAAAPEIWLRTARHPGVESLGQLCPQPGADVAANSPQIYSFDTWYDEAADFTSLYERIAGRVLELGRREQGVLYAVPGHPLVGEATVARIRQLAAGDGLPVTIVPGLSFIEPTLTALGLDALEGGLQIADADRLAAYHHPPFDPDRPALIAQLYHRRLASQVKLTLMNSYPDDHPISLVRAAATDKEMVARCPLYELDRQPWIDHLTTLYVPPLPHAASLSAFQETVARLRAPGGCPWDRQQSHQSLRPYLLEESYEALAALDTGDSQALAEELGDLLLQIALHVQIAVENGEFMMSDVIEAIDAKLRRRHPHVFGDVSVSGVSEVLTNWEAIKHAERAGAAPGDVLVEEAPARPSVLDGVPRAMPALARAQVITDRVVRVGFEWPTVEGVLDKLGEEARELAAAQSAEERSAELGDVLFVVVNLARWLGVDAESALRTTNERFSRRFRILEQLAAERQLKLTDLDIHALDGLWDEAKQLCAA